MIASSMSQAADPRPELAFGPNPFLEALPPPIAFKDLPTRLGNRPLAAINWQAYEPAQRECFLDASIEHFVSTAEVLEPAAGVQILLRRALVMRNALNSDERVRMNRIALLENKAHLGKIKQLDGAGMLAAAMTAFGKTALLRRILKLIAPEQVIDWGTSNACAWYQMRQCVYLIVDFASNGSRGGLLKRILYALDDELGTDYLADYEKVVNLDTLLVTVCKLLSLHRVALLVIDEKQQSTFEDSPWRLEFVLFYLTLMNLGISVVLSGNPLAFEHLFHFSQVMRRFSPGGVHRLEPAPTASTKWWTRDFVPGARAFNLVERWEVSTEERSALEFSNSGGLSGLYMPFHIEVQRSALRRGGSVATVTMKDFEAAMKSPRFLELKPIADSVTRPTDTSNRTYLDIPARSDQPSNDKGGSAAKPSPPSVPSDQAVAVVKRLLSRFTADQTKKANSLVKQLNSLKTLDPDDIRALGITQDHVNEMEKTLSSLSEEKQKKKKSKSDGEDSSSS